jgi:hypothetical protein
VLVFSAIYAEVGLSNEGIVGFPSRNMQAANFRVRLHGRDTGHTQHGHWRDASGTRRFILVPKLQLGNPYRAKLRFEELPVDLPCRAVGASAGSRPPLAKDD